MLNEVWRKSIDWKCINLRNGLESFAVSALGAVWLCAKGLSTESNEIRSKLIDEGEKRCVGGGWVRSTRRESVKQIRVNQERCREVRILLGAICMRGKPIFNFTTLYYYEKRWSKVMT